MTMATIQEALKGWKKRIFVGLGMLAGFVQLKDPSFFTALFPERYATFITVGILALIYVANEYSSGRVDQKG